MSSEAQPPAGSELLVRARALYIARRKRDRVFGSELFGEPAWDILLEASIAQLEGRLTCLTSLCHAGDVPLATGMRYIDALKNAGLLERDGAAGDMSVNYARPTAKGLTLMAELFGDANTASDSSTEPPVLAFETQEQRGL